MPKRDGPIPEDRLALQFLLRYFRRLPLGTPVGRSHISPAASLILFPLLERTRIRSSFTCFLPSIFLPPSSTRIAISRRVYRPAKVLRFRRIVSWNARKLRSKVSRQARSLPLKNVPPVVVESAHGSSNTRVHLCASIFFSPEMSTPASSRALDLLPTTESKYFKGIGPGKIRKVARSVAGSQWERVAKFVEETSGGGETRHVARQRGERGESSVGPGSRR